MVAQGKVAFLARFQDKHSKTQVSQEQRLDLDGWKIYGRTKWSGVYPLSLLLAFTLIFWFSSRMARIGTGYKGPGQIPNISLLFWRMAKCSSVFPLLSGVFAFQLRSLPVLACLALLAM